MKSIDERYVGYSRYWFVVIPAAIRLLGLNHKPDDPPGYVAIFRSSSGLSNAKQNAGRVRVHVDTLRPVHRSITNRQAAGGTLCRVEAVSQKIASSDGVFQG